MCVATNAGGEAVAIGLPKCIDTGVASLLTDLPAAITFASIEAGAFILSTLALSGSFLRHGTLISNSSEPEPHSQLSALGWIGLGVRQQSGNLDGVGKPVPVSDGLAFEPHFAARGLYQAAPATAGVRRGAPSDYSAPQPASATAKLTTLELPH